MDTWIVLANDDIGGHHRRGLYVLKSRGMAHSNELREFVLTDHGLDIAANGGPHGAVAERRTRHAGRTRSPCSSLRTTAPRRHPRPRRISCGSTSPDKTPKSILALTNLKQICEDHLQGRYEIEIIDLLENPQLAQGDQILALPTLVRRLPEPIKKIIGDLSNTERVLVGLDLRERR